MASLTGQLVAETYKALLKTIDNDILTASEKQITDGFGGGSNVFIDSQGFLRANKYKVTNGLATQFLKADGSLDSNTYLTGITSSQIISALGYTPVPTTRTLTINGTTYDLSANRSWTIDGTSAVWGNISGTLSNQTDLQTALNAKYNNPSGTISQYIRGDGTLATFPTLPGGLPTGGTAGQILAKIDATDYNTQWIDNYATQTKNEVKLGAALSKGTPVYVSSANGTNMIVSAASNTSEATSSKTFGLLETGGVLNDLVKCVTFGLLAGLDTSTASAGDPVWLGPNGTLLFGVANKPVAPAHMVYIGVVTRVQSNNGEIFVNVQNGFEIEELHDVLIQSKANSQGLFYESSTGLWKNKSIATVLGYTPQAQLDGTGFVKASGTTITYDNSTYLTTTDASSTYQRLDKMVSNLLASATEYPNSNAVINALALKADALNPVFTGYMTISGAEPKLYFTDTDQNPDYFIGADAGYFKIYDQTAGATRFQINSDGNISTGTGKSITAGSFIKDGGTASQFLKADGSIDSSTYVTSASLADYLLITTAASTYQRLDKMVSNLLASDTEYPNSNAVLAKLALKADAANPVFTGNMTISGAEPKLYLTDTDQNPDYFIGVDAGFFRIYNQTAGQTKFVINTDGDATFTNSVTATSIIKSGGTSSQYLMADGSVSTGPNLSGYALLNGSTANQFNVFELSYAATVFNPSAGARTTIDSMSIKMWNNYFNGTGLGSDYGTVMQYYSQAGHVESQVYFDAAGGSWYRTASYNAGYGSWQRYLTDANFTNWALAITGGTLSGTLTIGSTGGFDTATNDVYASMRVIRNNKAGGPGNDGMYIGYENSNSGITRIFGGGATSGGLTIEGAGNNSVKINSNIVLNAANYASYSPTLTGYGASGTWGIDISGASNRTYRAIIEDTRSAQRTPDDYEDYRTSWEFTNQIASGWRTAMTMQGWHNGYAAWQIIGPADTSANETWYLRSGVNTTWNPLRTIIHSGNIGAQSVTYADNAGAVGTIGESRIVYGENSTATTSISNATLDGALKSGFYTVGSGGIPNATGVNFVLHTAYAGVGNLAGFDLACNDSTTSSFYLRPATGGGKGAWQTIITSANIASQSVSYSSTAGLLNALANYVWNNASAASDYHNGISASFVSSAQGFPSYGSVMTMRTYSGAMGTLQLFTPYSPTYGGYRLGYRSSNYDTGTWDGWKYLLNSVNDPYAYNMNQYVRTTDDVTHQNLYVNSWFRNNTANAGLYNQALDTHFYASSNVQWSLATAGSSYIEVALRPSGHNTTIRGYLYANTSNEVGLLTYDGNWALRINGSRDTNLHGSLIVGYGQTSSNIYMYDGDENTRRIHCNSNRIGFLSSANAWGAWANLDGSWEASNFYSTYGLSNNADISNDRPFGLWFNGYNSTPYAIYREAGSWTYPYPDLRIAFHTGISLGANPSYGGVRFFSDYDMSTVVLYVNNASYGGAGNVYAVGTITATAFYESSDSRLKTLIDGNAQIEGIENLQAKLYEKDGKVEFGYFAQDAEELMPYAITKNADGFLSLSYREVHTAKIARLEKRVAELEKQLNLN